jgi:hypothetical protein
MSNDAISSERVVRAVDTMGREIKGDWGNCSLLATKYRGACKDLIEHPEERGAYWVKEKSNPPGKPK